MRKARTKTTSAVAFKAEYPPRRHDSRCTYFGGRPLLPEGLRWPTVKTGGLEYGLNFLGQVDLSEVAKHLPASPLPTDGILYFFLDTSLITGAGLTDWKFDDGLPWRVLYSPVRPSSCEVADPPMSRIIPCFGEPYETAPLRVTYPGPPTQLNWTDHIDWRQRYYSFEFPRIDMNCVPLESPRNESSDDQRLVYLRRAFGEPALHVLGQEQSEMGSIWQPDTSFPASKIYMEIAAGGLLRNILGPWPSADLEACGQPFVQNLAKNI